MHNGRVTLRPDAEIALRDDGYYLINPGTVGEPRTRDTRATYMLLDFARWTLTLRYVEYNASAPSAVRREAGLASFSDRLRSLVEGSRV